MSTQSRGGNALESQTIPMKALLRNNIRDYAMYIVLVLLFSVFGILTKGLFLSPRNLTDLFNQTGYVAVLAIGMTLILIIQHIDLSVGYAAGFLGAVAATLLSRGWSVAVTIPVILAIGVLIGLYQGFLVAKIKVPAFVTTLAGQFIFRGLLLLVTASTGTIIVRQESFRALSNGYIPALFIINGNMHGLTLVIGILAVLLYVFFQINGRKKKLQYGFKVISPLAFGLQMVLIAALILTFTWVMASYRGIPWSAVIIGAVLFIYNFVLNKTRLGRNIYAIGGNREAAELSGIKVEKVTLIVFASMSMLAALSGIMYTSRLASATPAAGSGFELDAIASAYIGGVSVSGGVGKVTNTIVGAIVIMSLTNGMNLLGVDVAYQYVVKGAIFILAVAFDVISRRK